MPATDHLDALQAAVRLARAALDGAAVTGPPVDFTPPPAPDEDLQPRDRDRAVALQRELEALVEELAAAQRRVGAELASLRRPRPDRTSVPDARYVDSYG